MIVIFSVRPLHKTVIFKGTKDHRLERNPMNVDSVVRPLDTTLLFKVIKEHTVEGNLMNVYQ